MVVGILDKFGNDVKALTIQPSGGGVYEIWKNGDLIFSKKGLGRFPLNDAEVINLL